MTLVKLDSGDYINTMYVIKTMTDTAGSVGKKNGQLVYLLDTGYQKITSADRDRIVEAMSSVTKSCKYCKSDGDWVCDPYSNEAFAVSEKTDGLDGYLETYLNSKIITIHYCPMCGRKLGRAHV